jgi:hypothetical protein
MLREKDLYVSGRELKDLVRAAGNDTMWVLPSAFYVTLYEAICSRKKEVFQTQLLPR